MLATRIPKTATPRTTSRTSIRSAEPTGAAFTVILLDSGTQDSGTQDSGTRDLGTEFLEPRLRGGAGGGRGFLPGAGLHRFLGVPRLLRVRLLEFVFRRAGERRRGRLAGLADFGVLALELGGGGVGLQPGDAGRGRSSARRRRHELEGRRRQSRV